MCMYFLIYKKKIKKINFLHKYLCKIYLYLLLISRKNAYIIIKNITQIIIGRKEKRINVTPNKFCSDFVPDIYNIVLIVNIYSIDNNNELHIQINT